MSSAFFERPLKDNRRGSEGKNNKNRETGRVFRAFFCGCHVPVCYVAVVALEEEWAHTQASTGEFYNGAEKRTCRKPPC